MLSCRKTLNTYWDFDLTQENIHNVSGVLKTFLREADPPILPLELMETVIPLFEGGGATEYGLSCLEELIQGLPRPNRSILKRVLGFGALVAANHKVNRMNIRNVALVLGPSLVRRRIDVIKKVGVLPTCHCVLAQSAPRRQATAALKCLPLAHCSLKCMPRMTANPESSSLNSGEHDERGAVESAERRKDAEQ